MDNFPDLEKIFSRKKMKVLKKWIIFQNNVQIFQIPISNIYRENPKIGISRKNFVFPFIPIGFSSLLRCSTGKMKKVALIGGCIILREPASRKNNNFLSLVVGIASLSQIKIGGIFN